MIWYYLKGRVKKRKSQYLLNHVTGFLVKSTFPSGQPDLVEFRLINGGIQGLEYYWVNQSDVHCNCVVCAKFSGLDFQKKWLIVIQSVIDHSVCYVRCMKFRAPFY